MASTPLADLGAALAASRTTLATARDDLATAMSELSTAQSTLTTKAAAANAAAGAVSVLNTSIDTRRAAAAEAVRVAERDRLPTRAGLSLAHTAFYKIHSALVGPPAATGQDATDLGAAHDALVALGESPDPADVAAVLASVSNLL